MKLHRHLSEEEINMRPPLHGAHKVGLCKTKRDNTVMEHTFLKTVKTKGLELV